MSFQLIPSHCCRWCHSYCVLVSAWWVSPPYPVQLVDFVEKFSSIAASLITDHRTTSCHVAHISIISSLLWPIHHTGDVYETSKKCRVKIPCDPLSESVSCPTKLLSCGDRQRAGKERFEKYQRMLSGSHHPKVSWSYWNKKFRIWKGMVTVINCAVQTRAKIERLGKIELQIQNFCFIM